MFHTYNFGSPTFQEWLSTTNQLYCAEYLELGGCKKDYLPLQVDAHFQDQFLLYIDDEAGVCGSAAITALPYDLEIESQVVPQDTWVLRNVFFHVRQSHPLQKQPDKLMQILEQFHLGLFNHLWQLAQRSNHKVTLILQHDLEAHEDKDVYVPVLLPKGQPLKRKRVS
jgi:hypothetical protein